MKRQIVAFLGLAVLATGCAPHDARLGESPKLNAIQHIIDPDPQFAGEVREGGSGVAAAAAVERYRKGTVKQPVSISTTTGIQGSSGGGGQGQ